MTTYTGMPGNSGLAASAAVITMLGIVAWFALGSAALPRPASAGAAASQFSAARAFVHVQALARTPRPIATAGNAQARQYIVDQLRAIGLAPEVHTTTVQKKVVDSFENTRVTLAVVHNIVVRKAGNAPDHAPRPALLLAAHYDSGESTLGAADGGASVAAMLETARALQAGEPPKYDVVFLFADGEKVGALGMQAFVEQHPLAPRIGLALKFDNPGSRGPLVLYDTSRAGSDVIAGWARGAGHATGSSLMREVYKLAPVARGIGPLAALDVPVLQFASVDGWNGWSGATDTPDRLDQGTLQHEGETMLGLVRQFTRQPLALGPQAGQVYFAIPPLGVVHYSTEAVWPFTRLACLLLVGVCCLAIQRANVEVVDIVKGTFGFGLIASALPLGAWLLWTHFPSLHHAASQSGQRYLLAICVLGAALFIWLQRRLQKAIGAGAAGLGALACIACVLVAVSWFMPGASYLLVWPLLAATTAVAALHSRRVAARPPALRLAILFAGLAPGLVLIAPVVREVSSVLTPARMNLPLTLLAVLLGLGTVLLAAIARRFAVRALALAGLGCLALASNASPSRPPPLQPNPLVYYKDMPTWRAWWLARPPALDGWSRQLFPNLEKPRRLVDVFGWDSEDLWYSPAERHDVAFPQAIMLKNEYEPRRLVEFVLTSKNRAPHIELWVQNGKPRRTTVNGRLLTDTESRVWSMSLYGMEDNPLHFSMDMSAETFVVHVEERMQGVPERVLPQRLPKAQFIPMTGTTIAADTLIFR